MSTILAPDSRQAFIDGLPEGFRAAIDQSAPIDLVPWITKEGPGKATVVKPILGDLETFRRESPGAIFASTRKRDASWMGRSSSTRRTS